MLRLTCFALLVTFVLGLELQAHIGGQWKKFKSVHGKKYSGAEEQKRKAIFKKNVETILKHNLNADLGEASYTMAVNEYSDMDHDEFVRLMGAASQIIRDYNSSATSWTPSRNFKARSASLDWRKHNAVTPVKNQGNCGACWAFCTTGSIEGAWAIKHKELIDLSPQNLVDCSKNGNNGCHGGTAPRTMKYIYDNGINSEQCYRYKGIEGKCTHNRNCRKIHISEYHHVQSGNEKDLMEAVTRYGPIAVSIDIKSPASLKHYGRGVYDLEKGEVCSQYSLNHCVTLVGYGTDGGKDYWLLKNSHGVGGPGIKGYWKFIRNKNLCGIASYAHFAIAR